MYYYYCSTATKNVKIIVLPSHTCRSHYEVYMISCCTVDSAKSAIRLTKNARLGLPPNVKNEQAQVCGGKLFHARAAATRKAQSPKVAR